MTSARGSRLQNRAPPLRNVENFWATHGAAVPFSALPGQHRRGPHRALEEWRTDRSCRRFVMDALRRGAADMKSGLAAMITATEEFVGAHPGHKGTIVPHHE